MHEGEFLKQFIKNKPMKVKAVVEATGYHRSTIYLHFDKPKLDIDIKSTYKNGIGIEWPGEEAGAPLSNEPATHYQMPTSNAKLIGDIFETEYEDGTRFRPIGNGRFMMRVPLVTEKAKAGFLAGYADPTYMAQLPQLETIVDFQAKGNYLAFDVEGDSMDDRSIEAIPDQSRVIVRELPQHQWMPRLYHHRWKNWVFAHKTEGVIIKQIADQNLEEGWIKYTCLNPNKELYPDKVIYLKDIQKIYNVIKRELLF